MNLQEIITAKVPGAVYTEAGDGMFAIPVEQFHDLARYLHDDPALRFDFLRSLTGMDWGEEGLGAVYHLESTATGENVVLKVLTPSREQCGLPTVSDIWKGAELNEREVFDFFGIGFINHPDMRRLYLRDDWVGYPLRKDYDQSGETNPLRMTNEVAHDSSPSYELQPDGSIIRRRNVLSRRRVRHQHRSSAPGHARRAPLPRIARRRNHQKARRTLRLHPPGHRKAVRKPDLSPNARSYRRLDTSALAEPPCALHVHREGTRRGGVGTRTVHPHHHGRIAAYRFAPALLLLSLYGYGCADGLLLRFRDREKVLDILEQTTGGRLIQAYNTIGGVQADIHPEFVKKVKELIKYLRPVLKEYHEIFTGNVIAQQRLKGTGVLTREDAVSFGATGGTGRASGWACDVRKRHPYAMYGKVDFREVLFTEGDCFARYMVRMEEILESLRIIEQLIDNIPEGEYQLKMKPVIRVPEGSYYAAVEGSRGEFGVYLESRGDKSPYRLKFRSTGLPLVSCMDTITRGAKIADLIAIGGTLDYVVPDIDR